MTRVRFMRADEADAVGALCVAAYVAGGHLDPGEPYAAEVGDARGRMEHTRLLVLEDSGPEGAVVATATACDAHSAYAEIAQPGEVELRFVAVDPAHWGRGLATVLMTHVEERCRAEGVDALVLCVLDVNTAAQALYPRLGYTRIAERDITLSPGRTLLAYRKSLR